MFPAKQRRLNTGLTNLAPPPPGLLALLRAPACRSFAERKSGMTCSATRARPLYAPSLGGRSGGIKHQASYRPRMPASKAAVWCVFS